MLLIGSHVSFKKDKEMLGSLMEALGYDATTFMFYTGAPQNTLRFDLNDELTTKAHELMKEKGIDLEKVIVHAPYIVNLANNQNESQYDFSINFIINECKRCEKLGIKYLVLHPGNHVGLGIDLGIENITNALNIILEKTSTVILLETMAGKGSEVGSNFDELKRIIDGIKLKDKIGVCLDTCHLFDSGYDVSNFDKLLEEFDEKIGLSKIGCVHVNDSKNIMGSRKDRHANIGYGNIGFNNLINVIYNDKLKDVPKILETPYILECPPYKFEIDMIRNKKFNENLESDVTNYYKKS